MELNQQANNINNNIFNFDPAVDLILGLHDNMDIAHEEEVLESAEEEEDGNDGQDVEELGSGGSNDGGSSIDEESSSEWESDWSSENDSGNSSISSALSHVDFQSVNEDEEMMDVVLVNNDEDDGAENPAAPINTSEDEDDDDDLGPPPLSPASTDSGNGYDDEDPNEHLVLMNNALAAGQHGPHIAFLNFLVNHQVNQHNNADDTEESGNEGDNGNAHGDQPIPHHPGIYNLAFNPNNHHQNNPQHIFPQHFGIHFHVQPDEEAANQHQAIIAHHQQILDDLLNESIDGPGTQQYNDDPENDEQGEQADDEMSDSNSDTVSEAADLDKSDENDDNVNEADDGNGDGNDDNYDHHGDGGRDSDEEDFESAREDGQEEHRMQNPQCDESDKVAVRSNDAHNNVNTALAENTKDQGTSSGPTVETNEMWLRRMLNTLPFRRLTISSGSNTSRPILKIPCNQEVWRPQPHFISNKNNSSQKGSNNNKTNAPSWSTVVKYGSDAFSMKESSRQNFPDTNNNTDNNNPNYGFSAFGEAILQKPYSSPLLSSNPTSRFSFDEPRFSFNGGEYQLFDPAPPWPRQGSFLFPIVDFINQQNQQEDPCNDAREVGQERSNGSRPVSFAHGCLLPMNWPVCCCQFNQRHPIPNSTDTTTSSSKDGHSKAETTNHKNQSEAKKEDNEATEDEMRRNAELLYRWAPWRAAAVNAVDNWSPREELNGTWCPAAELHAFVKWFNEQNDGLCSFNWMFVNPFVNYEGLINKLFASTQPSLQQKQLINHLNQLSSTPRSRPEEVVLTADQFFYDSTPHNGIPMHQQYRFFIKEFENETDTFQKLLDKMYPLQYELFDLYHTLLNTQRKHPLLAYRIEKELYRLTIENEWLKLVAAYDASRKRLRNCHGILEYIQQSQACTVPQMPSPIFPTLFRPDPNIYQQYHQPIQPDVDDGDNGVLHPREQYWTDQQPELNQTTIDISFEEVEQRLSQLDKQQHPQDYE